jgi:hypothetical protein
VGAHRERNRHPDAVETWDDRRWTELFASAAWADALKTSRDSDDNPRFHQHAEVTLMRSMPWSPIQQGGGWPRWDTSDDIVTTMFSQQGDESPIQAPVVLL